jgi:hypothetical protein
VEPVRRDEREERGSERDDEVRPQARLALAQLALEPDRTAEQRSDRETQQDVRPFELGDRRDKTKRL